MDPSEEDSISEQVSCQRASPLRPLDWRWRRAGYAVEQNRRPRRGREEEIVLRAVRFRRNLASRGGDPDAPGRHKLDPSVLGAYRVRFGQDQELQSELEARLVAGQTSDVIADRTGLTADLIEVYETLYFEVKERLGASDWVVATVLGRRYYEGTAEEDVDLIWKAVAYNLGPYALDALLEGLRHPGSTPIPAARDPQLDELVKLYALVLTTPVTPENALSWLRINHTIVENERNAAASYAGPLTRPLAAAYDSFFSGSEAHAVFAQDDILEVDDTPARSSSYGPDGETHDATGGDGRHDGAGDDGLKRSA
jgi:hypothetical protein